MAIPTGLGASFGIGEESTYGTPVTPTRWYEMRSEAFKMDVSRIESASLRAGTFLQRSDRWASGKRNVTGHVDIELVNKSMGLLQKHMFGQDTITTPGGGTNARDHTSIPVDPLPTGLTVQIGRPSNDGTARSFTYHGCIVTGWELNCGIDEIPLLGLDFVGEDEDVVTSLTAVSYPSTVSLFNFTQGLLSIAGSDFPLDHVRLFGTNGLGEDRYKLGSQLRRKPLQVAPREYGGDLTGDFVDFAAYNRFVNGTEAALVLTFTGALIEGAINYKLVVTCNVRFDGDTPNVGGPDEVRMPLRFKCVDSGSGPGSAITWVATNTDTVA